GFDHVAVATGAGRPTIIDMKNNLIRGIRKASDFLMALQLTGAFKREALPNLQARLPAIVIGGGLTAIDTATELMAYYPLQVEKTVTHYDALVAELGEPRVRALFDVEELEVLDEYLVHGRAIRAERARAEHTGTFQLDAKKKFFQPHVVVRNDDGTFHLRPDAKGFFTSYGLDGRFVSYYGDNHPRYAGNVVKAMASAKDGFPHVVSLFAREL